MMSLASLRALVDNLAAEWRDVRFEGLQFSHRGEARLVLVAVLGLTVILLLARSLLGRQSGRHRVVLPALLRAMPRSRASFLRHAPVPMFVAGLGFFTIAFADPYSALVRREATFPGRRICLMVDASTSMRTPFTAASLNPRTATDATFFTTVAAAERFVRLRNDNHRRRVARRVR